MPNCAAVSGEVSFPIGCDLKQMSDEFLVETARSGHGGAFNELRARHSGRILRTTYQITRSQEDAEDALQDTFLRVFTHLDRFEGRAKFSTWLTRIAINSSFMILRKRRGCREIPMEVYSDEVKSSRTWEPRNPCEDPEERRARGEMEEQLVRAIRRLTPDHRRMIELRVWQDCSMKELSECLGVSLPAAKSRLLRAKKALRSSLRERSC